jgi:hypothetical protein
VVRSGTASFLWSTLAKSSRADMTDRQKKQRDDSDYNRYDSTTVRPNFFSTSLGVSICRYINKIDDE